VDEDAKSDYYDSIHHSAGVVGINTSALIESAILGRRVHSLLSDDFAGTQAGTLHFAHIADDQTGFLHVSRTFEEHVAHLREAITGGPGADRRARAFVQRFVRPHGLDAPATPYLVDAFASAASSEPGAPEPRPAAARVGLLTATIAVRLYRVLQQKVLERILNAVPGARRRTRRTGGMVDRTPRREQGSGNGATASPQARELAVDD
jgi:hypothetical protein